MRKISSILVMPVLVTAFFTCCDKEAVNIEYPAYKPKMVISGYISPDNRSNLVAISSNFRIYCDALYTMNDLGNVNASVSNGDIVKALDTTINAWFAFKFSGIPVEEGRTYRLKVNSNVGSVEAFCTVPYKRKFNLKLDTIRAPLYHPGYYNVELSLTDSRGEENFYQLFCEQVIYVSGKASFRKFQFSERNYFDDKGKDGSEFLMHITGAIGTTNMIDSSFIKVFLLNMDKNYYNFQKSLDNYNPGEDPFTEPYPVYSNVTGGLGIFAAYTMDSLIFRLK